MGSHSQAGSLCSVEDTFCLRDRKRSALAEDIDEGGQFLSSRFWNHFVANEVHIGIGSLLKLLRDHMGPQKGGGHSSGPLLRRPADGTQGLEF